MDGGIFTVNASGRIGFDTTLDLKTTMYFSSAFSLAMAAGIKELDNLLDDNDRLVIPVLIQGRAGAPIILPDVEKLLTVAGKKVLMKQAEKKLGEALGGAGKGLGSVFGF